MSCKSDMPSTCLHDTLKFECPAMTQHMDLWLDIHS